MLRRALRLRNPRDVTADGLGKVVELLNRDPRAESPKPRAHFSVTNGTFHGLKSRATVRLWLPKPRRAAASANKPKTTVSARSIASSARDNSTSACGKTDCTIARPAAKLATTGSGNSRTHLPRFCPRGESHHQILQRSPEPRATQKRKDRREDGPPPPRRS